MHKFRITKYDPAKRNEEGAYLEDEWTDASDVGKQFKGIELTSKKFFDVETLYVEAALRFFDASGLSHLRVTGIESEYIDAALKKLQKDQPYLHDPGFTKIDLSEDKLVDRAGIELICRMNLRNILWCRLEAADRFFINFGWDFYMYVGSLAESLQAITDTEAGGLYVEDFESPYSPGEGEVPRFTLSIWDKASGDDKEVSLKRSTFKDIRELFSFSDEHSMYGIFIISPSMVPKLQPLVDIKLDAEKFDYNLDTTGFEGDGFEEEN